MRTALSLALALVFSACADEAPEAPEAADEPTSAASGVLPEGDLLARFPETVAGFPQLNASTSTDGALGFEVSRAGAIYKETTGVPGPQLGLNLLDLGSADMAQNMGYGWGLAGVPDTTILGYPARIENRVGYRTVQLLVGERFLVEALSKGLDESVDEALLSLDLAGLTTIAAE